MAPSDQGEAKRGGVRSRPLDHASLVHSDMVGENVTVMERMYFLSSSPLVGPQRESYRTVLLSFCNESFGEEKSKMAASARCQSPLRVDCTSFPPVRLALTQYNVALLDHPRILGVLGVWSPGLHHPLHLGKRRRMEDPWSAKFMESLFSRPHLRFYLPCQ
jgi:hypothetical protein